MADGLSATPERAAEMDWEAAARILADATKGADEVWITSDNPRNESPQHIIAEILAGTGTKVNSQVHVEPERARAIFEAIGDAHQGDVVLIAGKGHEDYQEIAGERVPFSDVAVANKALGAWT